MSAVMEEKIDGKVDDDTPVTWRPLFVLRSDVMWRPLSVLCSHVMHQACGLQAITT